MPSHACIAQTCDVCLAKATRLAERRVVGRVNNVTILRDRQALSR
jgi:hypothetical protein